jgi:hypothetical protein
MTTFSQLIQATKCKLGCPLALCILTITLSNDEFIIQSSSSPAKHAAMIGKLKVNLTNKIPPKMNLTKYIERRLEIQGSVTSCQIRTLFLAV